ncbi:MAG: hypothetical protein O7C01_05480 [Actinobacteria bacterium]|nr:hypothetical protein [Actinomycetota bacterium]
MRYRQWFGYLAAILLLAAACGDDTPAAGLVTIETEIDFSSEPYGGTFEVTEGADILGCSGGTFVDSPQTNDIKKLLTCTSGSNAGTFTIVFAPGEYDSGPGDDNGPWSILEGTDDFTSLEGGGAFWVIYDPNDLPKGVETMTGEIELTS